MLTLLSRVNFNFSGSSIYMDIIWHSCMMYLRIYHLHTSTQHCYIILDWSMSILIVIFELMSEIMKSRPFTVIKSFELDSFALFYGKECQRFEILHRVIVCFCFWFVVFVHTARDWDWDI